MLLAAGARQNMRQSCSRDWSLPGKSTKAEAKSKALPPPRPHARRRRVQELPAGVGAPAVEWAPARDLIDALPLAVAASDELARGWLPIRGVVGERGGPLEDFAVGRERRRGTQFWCGREGVVESLPNGGEPVPDFGDRSGS